MGETSEILWPSGELTVLVLALWLAVEILFQRRDHGGATRVSHLADGGFLLLFDLVWAGLCGFICFTATWTGAGPEFFTVAFGIGGGIFLVVLWGAGRHFVQALHAGSQRRRGQA